MYNPFEQGVVAIVNPVGLLISHIPLLKLTEQFALSSLLIDIRGNALSDA